MPVDVPVDYSRLKLLCILEGPGEAVLSHALKCGTNKTASVNLVDYLRNLPETSTANYCVLNGDKKRKAFTGPEKRQIADDPSCQTFDMTLLHKCIRLACENVAGFSDPSWQDDNVMEGLITKIKQERNVLVHERPQMTEEHQLLEKVKELESLFSRSLRAIKDKYGVSEAETTNVRDSITRKMQDILQAFTEKVFLEMSLKKRLDFFKNESVGHLRNIYKKSEFFDPLSFLSGSPEERVHIQTIFSKPVLKQQPKDNETDFFDVLKFLRPNIQGSQFSHVQPQLVVVSGLAGSGKTTLLTFILSEWLKEDCDRSVRHLEEYNIVLRIMCRDREAETLQEFLDLVLPSSLSVFNEPFMSFLKHCKVLFLIDGLDELNNSSEKLLNDILLAGKYNRNFSILATSRPERVNDFLANTRRDYQQWHISIEGIPVTERINFALQYSTSTNQDRLRELIATKGDMKLFQLPLNILFLVTLFQENPNCIKDNTTQSNLYTNIHEWCIEKLHNRISVHAIWGRKKPETRKVRIKRVLKEMYQMALQGLLQDRLSLADEDIERLADCCEKEDLPSQEVLGAFFNLRSSVTNRVVRRQYYIPHKGMLEYFAAQHIMHCLQDRSLPNSGAIICLLRDAIQPKTEVLHIRSLRNLFWQLACLLSKADLPKRSETIKEVIHLLAETGLRWREWLSLVEDTFYEESILHGIAHRVTENPPDDKLLIENTTLASAAALLPRIPATTVILRLENEKVNVKHVGALTGHRFRTLNLWHHFKNPGQIPASDSVLRAIERSHLKDFTGHLSGDCMVLLPDSLELLFLVVSNDEHAGSLLAALTKAASSLPNLGWLVIHIPMTMVTPQAVLSPLPNIRSVVLVLSGVDRSLIKEACQVAAALQPRNRGQQENWCFP
ncbi:uncharacterized protein LOC135110171 isoform X2 [Scylla paramamosain]|uniref:uncharacterized protein LOC135110171 isoform X2 n=1 Tax=Scylla paramamosain TaxID=85552 RepID=UPI003083983D